MWEDNRRISNSPRCWWPELEWWWKRWSNSDRLDKSHSSALAWKIPWAEKPGRLQPMGWLRVGHNWATSLSLSCIGEGNGNPLQCSCLENPRDGGAWWAAIYGVTQSRTWLKQLSSSSSREISRHWSQQHMVVYSLLEVSYRWLQDIAQMSKGNISVNGVAIYWVRWRYSKIEKEVGELVQDF